MSDEQRSFFDAVFGDNVGHIFICTRDTDNAANFKNRPFLWPLQAEEMLTFANTSNAQGYDVYFSTMLYKSASDGRRVDNALLCTSLYADMDHANPYASPIVPNVVLETSPGRFDGFWRLNKPVSPREGAELSKRIAYATGADKSGWDITQILRIPGTKNRKYADKPVVTMPVCNTCTFTPEAITSEFRSRDLDVPLERAQRPVAPRNSGDGMEVPPDVIAGAESLLRTSPAPGDNRSDWHMRTIAQLLDMGMSEAWVHERFSLHPTYLEKAAERWGGSDDAIHKDIDRCIAQWIPTVRMELRATKGRSADTDAPDDPNECPATLSELIRRINGGEDYEKPFEFKPLNAADFLLQEEEELAWIVDGYIREQALTYIYGPPGGVKTVWATDLAVSVCTGTPFLGHPVEQKSVLILQEDTGKTDFRQHYLTPIVKSKGLTPLDVDGKLYVAPQSTFKLDEVTKAWALVQWIEEYRPGLIVMDAFYLLHSRDGMTTSEKDLGPVIALLLSLRNAYQCSLLIIDHTKKGDSKGLQSADPVDTLYGGRAKSAVADAMMMSTPEKDSQGCTTIHVVKLRGRKRPDPQRVVWNGEKLAGVMFTPAQKEAATAPLLAADTAIYRWLFAHKGAATREEIIKGLAAQGVEIADGTTSNALTALTRDEFPRVDVVGKRGRAVLYQARIEVEADTEEASE